MTYVIGEACVDVRDGACLKVCPVDCIHFEAGIDRKLYIEPDDCIDCGACEPACPYNAIFADSDLPADQAIYLDLERLYFQDREAARKKLNEIKPPTK